MNKIREIWANRWVRFSFVSIIYVLWFVVWTQNLLWILGVAVVYDYYISRYMDRLFLNKYRVFKSRNKTLRITMEWIESLLYAVIVVIPLKLYFFSLYVIPSSSMEQTLLIGDYLYLDRLHYGPKMANTPLSFPFVQHTLPLTEDTPSFVDWIQFDYKRLAGFSTIKNDDVVVFNFPAGDTVALFRPNNTYYDLVRYMGYDEVHRQSKVIYRPVDKRENYIKRCVAIAGDSLQIINGLVYVNGQQQKPISGVQYTYIIQTNGGQIPSNVFKDLGVNMNEVSFDSERNLYSMPLTERGYELIKSLPNVVMINRYINQDLHSDATFPHRPILYPWNEDQYGPIWIPKAGVKVDLNLSNLPLYERIIKNYENNSLEVDASGEILVNGVATKSYTFKMDYYFMMGDNRHNSADSRFWGFVPIDHIEGKASFIWLSITPGENIFTGIRWDRLFKSIN